MHAPDEGRYDCPHCGEEIVVPIDADAGAVQEYVEDCPICCSPILLRVNIEEDGEVRIVARPE